MKHQSFASSLARKSTAKSSVRNSTGKSTTIGGKKAAALTQVPARQELQSHSLCSTPRKCPPSKNSRKQYAQQSAPQQSSTATRVPRSSIVKPSQVAIRPALKVGQRSLASRRAVSKAETEIHIRASYSASANLTAKKPSTFNSGVTTQFGQTSGTALVRAKTTPTTPKTSTATKSTVVPASPIRPHVPLLVQAGRSGDHPEIQQLLLNVFHAPSKDEFHAWSEKPGYEPHQRLLIKQQNHLAAHLLLTDMQMRFGQADLPVKQLHWLATTAEFREQGMATSLVQAAEERMRAGGAVLGVLRTTNPHFFSRLGWGVCGRQSVSHGRARDILARISSLPSSRRWSLNVRYWRHVELPSLQRIYQQNMAHAYGPLVRSEEDWRWLLSRKAFDHIIVAINGRDRMELEDTNAPLVGYAVMRGQRVVEMLTSPGFEMAQEQLLARACGEMIENDRQEIFVDAPPASLAHRLIAESGGEFRNQEQLDDGEVLMVKVINPTRLVKLLQPEFQARFAAAEARTALELGFNIEGQKNLLAVTRKQLHWKPDLLGRNSLSLREAEFARLLLGHRGADEAAASGRVTSSSRVAVEIAKKLFPAVQWWRPSWDELPAS